MDEIVYTEYGYGRIVVAGEKGKSKEAKENEKKEPKISPENGTGKPIEEKLIVEEPTSILKVSFKWGGYGFLQVERVHQGVLRKEKNKPESEDDVRNQKGLRFGIASHQHVI